MEDHKRKNPWLGLESYAEGEVLYGRDDDIRDLTQSVLNDVDTLLYGKSGIGKSSILNAGVIPAARRYGYLPVLVRLSHKEQHSYLQQIKNAIANAMIPIPLDESGNQMELTEDERSVYDAELGRRIKKVLECRDKSKETLYEYFHRFTFHNEEGERIKLLIIFDQFEEIFTLQSDESKKKRFFEELADLLNDIMPSELQSENASKGKEKQETVVVDDGNFDDIFEDIKLEVNNDIPEYITDNDIHMVFTIREDFLSEFEYYSASIPSLKQNRYGLRPINEEQAAQIILRPMPGLIDEHVAKLIIEKVTGRTDFDLDGVPEINVDSAVLSLYLNRLYDAKTGDKITSKLVEDKGGEIIADFYHDAISEISESTVEFLENRLLNGQARRDNITVYDAVHGGGVTEEELNILCNKKKILRQFNYAGDLRIEYVHDILCSVVKEHMDARAMAKQQEEEKLRQEEEKQRILREEEAKRKKIEQEAEAEKVRLMQEAIRTRRRNRNRLYAIGVFVVILMMGIAEYYWQYEWIHESYYAQFERVNGWPVGVGKELSIEERHHLPLYYKLYHKGRLKYDTDLEVCSSNERLPRIPRLFCLEVCEADSDSCAIEYLNLLSHIKSIHFEAGEKDRLVKELIRGENDSILYYINYFYVETEGQVWAQFLSAKGQAMAVRENGLDRIKMSWNVFADENDVNKGKVTSMMYFDAQGVSTAGAYGIYGYELDYSKDGNTTYVYSMDAYGRPFDAPSNMIITCRSENSTETQYAHATSVPDSMFTPAIGPNGFWREVRNGNEKLLYLPGQDKPAAKCTITTFASGNTKELKMEGQFPATQPAHIKYTYADGSGYRTSEEKRNADGTPFNSSDGIYKRVWDFNAEGLQIKEEHYNTKDEKVFSHYIHKKDNVNCDVVENVFDKEYPIVVRWDSVDGDHKSTTYYAKDNEPINYKAKGEKFPYHRIEVDKKDNVRTTRFFSYDTQSKKIVRQPIIKDDFGAVTAFYCEKEVLDEEKNVVSRQIFDENETIVKSMMYYYQGGQNIGRAVMGIDGRPVRCPNWEEESYVYYILYYTKDFSNEYSSAIGVNEWERTSILYDLPSNKYRRIVLEEFKKGELKNANNDPFPMRGSHRQFIFIDDNVTSVQIPYLHILSKESPLYKCNNGKGLKDGDRIIKLGNWNWQMPESILLSEWQNMTKEQKEITVLRPTKTGLEKRKFVLRVDASELNLAEYHMLALTKDELKNIKR